MSLDALTSEDAAAITIVESYLRSSREADSNHVHEEAEQIVRQAADACRAFAAADQRQLCKLSLRMASQRVAETIPQSVPLVIPTETPVRMSLATPVRAAAPIRFSYWREWLRSTRPVTVAVKS